MQKKLFSRLIPKSRNVWLAISLFLILALLFPIVQTVVQIRQEEAFAAITSQEHLEAGLQYLEDDEYSLAFNEFNLAISKDSEYIDAYYERGVLLLLAGEPGLANANLSYVIQWDPARAEAYYYRALSYQELAQLMAQAATSLADETVSIELKETGLFDLDTLIGLDPEDLLPEISQTENVEIDQLEAAEIEDFPVVEAASSAVNPYAKALEDLSQAIKNDEDYADAYLARAYLLFGLNDYPSVVEDLTKNLSENCHIM